MPRTARTIYPEAIYHVIHRGNNRQKIFHDKKDYQKYLNLLKEGVEEFGVILYAFGLMATHLHLLLETPRGNISNFMKSVDLKFAQWHKKKYDIIGHLFQGRFKSIIVDKDNYLLQVSRYIHLQGVKAGLAKRPEDYPWTSYSSYIGERKLSFVEVEEVLNYFRGSEAKRRAKYWGFINEMVGKALEIKAPPVYSGYIYGNKELGEKIEKEIERRAREEKGRLRRKEDKTQKGVIKFQDILKQVSEFYGEEPESILYSRSYDFTSFRHQLVYLLRRYTNLSLVEIGEKIGSANLSTVRKAVEKVKKKRQENQQLDSHLGRIEEGLRNL